MERALDRLGVGWSGWPDSVTAEGMTPRDQLVALLLIMDASPELVNGWRHGTTEDVLVRSLPRKKLMKGNGMPVNVRGGDALFFRNRPHPPELALGALACVAGDRPSAVWWLEAAGQAVDPLSHAHTQAQIDYWKQRIADEPPA